MSHHLGQRISALIDGELSDAERDRVLTHIAGCDDAAEAVALRALKRRMHSLGEAMVDAALTGRLIAMAIPPNSTAVDRPPAVAARGCSRRPILTAGILASAVTGSARRRLSPAVEQQAPGPKIAPAVDTFLVQRAIVTGDLPVTSASGTPGGTASAAPVQPGPGRRQRPRRDQSGHRGGRARGAPSASGQAASGQATMVRRPVVRRPVAGRPVAGSKRPGGRPGSHGLRQPVPGSPPRPPRPPRGDRVREPGAVS